MVDPRPELRCSEPHYVAWMRERQRSARRLGHWLSRRRAQPDLAHEERVDPQTLVWAERHAHESRLHDSAIEQLRHHGA
ncbi:hypothetical protein [Vulcanococcus sp.]|uniref:hypothetical protein n=1 Tax=Vulcanococcus sp. TaxID=2856995 RepID=UPI003C0087FD